MSNRAGTTLEILANKTLAHGEPLPTQIARRLREAIEAGQFGVGAKLPSEPDLAALFRVSRNTAREALRLLIAEGVLDSRKGVGTFVRDHAPHPVETGIEQLTSTTEMIRAAGYVPGCRGYKLELMPAGAATATALELEGGSLVYRLERLRLADEKPVIHCVDFLAQGHIEDAVMRSYGGAGSLFAFLEGCGLTVKVARTILRPSLPRREVAQALELAPDEPVLLLEQTHYDGADRPFLYSENTIDSHFIEFHVRRIPGARTSVEGGAAG